MLQASGLAMSFGGQHLFSDVTFQLNRGDRLALVGPNGAGKSTLFSLLLGLEQPDAGFVTRETGVAMGWLPQETAPVGEETVLELACATGGGPLSGWAAADETVGDFSLEIDDVGLAQRQAKAKRILAGLAFRERDFDRPARELSGGWVMRAHLARLLVLEPDLLLLDEPTNHLDLESLGWFQGHLQHYRGAILLVSHDREFLNALAQGILELRGGRLHRYRGNYEDYLVERAAREAQHLAAYKNQQREIESLQRFADRFRAKASKAAQAQSKLKQIERMEKIAAPEESTRTVKIRFPQPPRVGQIPLRLQKVHFAYPGGQPVYQGMEFECERGDRIALVGPNGAGKSTLLKLLGGVLKPDAGERLLGYQARTGYFSQNRLDMFQPGRTVMEEALAIENPAPEQLTRTVLGSFLFSGDAIYKRVEVLSGGEKSRLGLVKLLLDPPNVLLMDEPTTHLDMASIDALVAALQQFEGTIIFISHDVYFIRSLATRVLRISAGQLTWFAGGYDYYLDKSGVASARAGLVSDGRPAEAAPAATVPAGPTKTSVFKSKEQKRAEAQARQDRAAQRRALQQAVRELEQEIAELEKRQTTLTEELENPATYEAGGQAMAINRELLGVAESLERRQADWEKAALALEKFDSASGSGE